MATKTINLRKLPAELHLSVKLAAAEEGVTIESWVVAAIMEKIGREIDYGEQEHGIKG